MKVSIITVNLNNCNGLQKTIDSVVCQTYNDYDWIVVDGGSTDGSRELIEQYSSRFSYWISEQDTGVYCAMNKGINAAKGEYVIFMNSGDYFADSNVLSNVACDLDCDIVAGYIKYDKTGVETKSPAYLTPRHLFRQNIPHQAEFIRRSLFKEISMYSEDLRILSDFEFNVKAAMQDRTYKVINQIVSIVEPDGISNKYVSLMKEEDSIIKERLMSDAVRKDYDYWMKIEKYLSSVHIDWAVNKGWPLKVIKVLYKLFS